MISSIHKLWFWIQLMQPSIELQSMWDTFDRICRTVDIATSCLSSVNATICILTHTAIVEYVARSLWERENTLTGFPSLVELKLGQCSWGYTWTWRWPHFSAASDEHLSAGEDTEASILSNGRQGNTQQGPLGDSFILSLKLFNPSKVNQSKLWYERIISGY